MPKLEKIPGWTRRYSDETYDYLIKTLTGKISRYASYGYSNPCNRSGLDKPRESGASAISRIAVIGAIDIAWDYNALLLSVSCHVFDDEAFKKMRQRILELMEPQIKCPKGKKFFTEDKPDAHANKGEGSIVIKFLPYSRETATEFLNIITTIDALPTSLVDELNELIQSPYTPEAKARTGSSATAVRSVIGERTPERKGSAATPTS